MMDVFVLGFATVAFMVSVMVILEPVVSEIVNLFRGR